MTRSGSKRLLTTPRSIRPDHRGTIHTRFLSHTYIYIYIHTYLEAPNAFLLLPFRKKATLPGKRRLLMLPGVFKPAPAILVCRFFEGVIHVCSRRNCP